MLAQLAQLDELLRLCVSSRRNFMSQWTMADEDWIGRMGRLAIKNGLGVPSKITNLRLSNKLVRGL